MLVTTTVRPDPLATREKRRSHYLQNVREVFAATADLYYAYWGKYFHLAIFEPGDDGTDFEAALERTHERYFDAIHAREAGRILELACGGGAFSKWMADRAPGEVVGVDVSDAQLAHARRHLAGRQRQNLRFVEHDIMRLADWDAPAFDAAICLDAACYLPDKPAALRAIATRLSPGARLLLVDWCRPERATRLQEELVLEPFYRAWAIPEMMSAARYRRAFQACGFRVAELEDLSERVAPNWERGYQLALRALAAPLGRGQVAMLARSALKHGPRALQLAKTQFYAALLAKSAADAGLLRYVLVLGERM